MYKRQVIANAVHYLIKKDRITVQLINTENRGMLQRLGISNIIVWDDIGGYILANSVFDPNSLAAFCHLAKDSENRISIHRIIDTYIGKTYGELFDYYFHEHGKLLLGLMKKEPELEMSAIFTADSSGIDQFIEYALAKSKRVIQEDKSAIRWNPQRSSVIQVNEHAILLDQGR